MKALEDAPLAGLTEVKEQSTNQEEATEKAGEEKTLVQSHRQCGVHDRRGCGLVMTMGVAARLSNEVVCIIVFCASI